ncbi:MAG: biopolymer transporter ExbD, partial [Planctomycetota bacterium]
MEFARRPRRRSTIELTPLIDVVFQLLVFFLLTSSFVQPSLRLDLPRGATLDDPDPTPIIVEIDAEGQIAVDGEIVESDELVPALE